MDTAQWPQEMVVKPIEEIVVKNSSSKATSSSVVVEKKPRPQKEQALNCPRCHSINTKFCYYNNYSLTQPRYFCKTCRRYWTEGGSLRNIPVGGGSRKNKRSSLSSNNTSNSNNIHNNNSPSLPSKLSNNIIPDLITTIPKLIHQGQDLNLAFPSSTTPDFTNISQLVLQQNNNSVSASSPPTTTTTTTTNSQLSAMELLNSRGLNLNAFNNMPLPDPNSVNYTCGLTFPMQDFKPTLNFSLDGIASGYTNLQGVHETSRRILFPFEDLKQVSSNTTMDQNNDKEEHHGDSNGYWTGMLGSGSW